MTREIEKAILLAEDISQLTFLLRALAPGPDEDSHVMADAILLRAIQLLTEGGGNAAHVAELMKAYNDLEKWYA